MEDAALRAWYYALGTIYERLRANPGYHVSIVDVADAFAQYVRDNATGVMSELWVEWELEPRVVDQVAAITFPVRGTRT